jgi:hypothetical protein
MAAHQCLPAFVGAPNDDNFATFIDEVSPECVCEEHQVSEHCPDPVDSNEVLVRLVMDPSHIHDDGSGIRLKSSFFNVAATAGASCLRQGRAAELEYQVTARMILAENPTTPDGQPRKVYGVVMIPVKRLRELRIVLDQKTGEDIRAFCVYATGTADRPNHADVLVHGVRRYEKLTRSKQNRTTDNLAKEFQRQIVPVQQFVPTADLTAFA